MSFLFERVSRGTSSMQHATRIGKRQLLSKDRKQQSGRVWVLRACSAQFCLLNIAAYRSCRQCTSAFVRGCQPVAASMSRLFPRWHVLRIWHRRDASVAWDGHPASRPEQGLLRIWLPQTRKGFDIARITERQIDIIAEIIVFLFVSVLAQQQRRSHFII